MTSHIFCEAYLLRGQELEEVASGGELHHNIMHQLSLKQLLRLLRKIILLSTFNIANDIFV